MLLAFQLITVRVYPRLLLRMCLGIAAQESTEEWDADGDDGDAGLGASPDENIGTIDCVVLESPSALLRIDTHK